MRIRKDPQTRIAFNSRRLTRSDIDWLAHSFLSGAVCLAVLIALRMTDMRADSHNPPCDRSLSPFLLLNSIRVTGYLNPVPQVKISRAMCFARSGSLISRSFCWLTLPLAVGLGGWFREWHPVGGGVIKHTTFAVIAVDPLLVSPKAGLNVWCSSLPCICPCCKN